MDQRDSLPRPCNVVWQCKIGVLGNLRHLLPRGADEPMREAIGRRFERVLGMPAEFTFSGWGADLTEGELAVVEDRLPDRSKVTREIPYDVTDEMAEAAARALYEQGFGYDIDADSTARTSMLSVARIALTAAIESGERASV